MSRVCNNLEGNVGDALVGNDNNDGFGIGNPVVDLLEEYGDGCIWGPLRGHFLLVEIDNLECDCDIPVVEIGDDVEGGNSCVPKIHFTSN